MTDEERKAVLEVAACLEKYTPNFLDREPQSALIKRSRRALDNLYETTGEVQDDNQATA